MIVHAATGSGPFTSDSPYVTAYQVVHDEPDLTGVPKDMTPLLRLCLAKDPAERPTPALLIQKLHDASSPLGRLWLPHNLVPAGCRRN